MIIVSLLFVSWKPNTKQHTVYYLQYYVHTMHQGRDKDITFPFLSHPISRWLQTHKNIIFLALREALVDDLAKLLIKFIL